MKLCRPGWGFTYSSFFLKVFSPHIYSCVWWFGAYHPLIVDWKVDKWVSLYCCNAALVSWSIYWSFYSHLTEMLLIEQMHVLISREEICYIISLPEGVNVTCETGVFPKQPPVFTKIIWPNNLVDQGPQLIMVQTLQRFCFVVLVFIQSARSCPWCGSKKVDCKLCKQRFAYHSSQPTYHLKTVS